ncbi:MAG: hypothetical protein QM479_11480 [Pseudomonadota bacterium]
MKFKKILSYLLLAVFCIQTASAAFDLHAKKAASPAIDITNQYIEHYNYNNSLQCTHGDKENHSQDSSNEQPDHHHGCSGHLTYSSFRDHSDLNIRFSAYTTYFIYHSGVYSTISTPDFRPPIFS